MANLIRELERRKRLRACPVPTTIQIHCAGATQLVKITPKQSWFYVDFECGLRAKISPYGNANKNTVSNSREIASRAEVLFEGLTAKQLTPAIKHALRHGACQEEFRWSCIKLGLVAEDVPKQYHTPTVIVAKARRMIGLE